MKIMDKQTLAKLSSKKSLISLRALLCCQANKEDLVTMESDSKPLQSSPGRDFSSLENFFTKQICRHGNDNKYCVTCYFSHSQIETIKVSNGGNNMSAKPGLTKLTEAQRSYYDNLLNGNNVQMTQNDSSCHAQQNNLNCSFCQGTENNNNDYGTSTTRSTSTNTYITGYINSAAEDDDAQSLCSSCYPSNCSQCYNFNHNMGTNHNDATEFSFYASQNFDAEALSKLLRGIDQNLAVPPPCCSHDDTFMCDCNNLDLTITSSSSSQGEECGSTGTGSSEKSRNDKDSGVGRTDDSTKNEESSEQVNTAIVFYPLALYMLVPLKLECGIFLS